MLVALALYYVALLTSLTETDFNEEQQKPRSTPLTYSDSYLISHSLFQLIGTA